MIRSGQPLHDVVSDMVGRRIAAEKVVVAQLVTGRNTDGTTRVQRLDRVECIERSCVTADSIGALVVRDPHCLGQAGSTGISTVTRFGGGIALWVTALSPDSYEQGQSYTVTVTGRGFRNITRIEFLISPEETHPGITITDTRFIDDETLEVDIDVAVDAEILENLSVAFGHVL